MQRILLPTLVFILTTSLAGCQYEGAKKKKESGFKNAVELHNAGTTVVLVPNIGGRVLKYEVNGNDVLYQDPSQNGIEWEPGNELVSHPSAGRFDIGPEKTAPKRPELFFGTWNIKITGDREATMISPRHEGTGVQLTRIFKLDEETSKLECTQIITNISNETKRYFFWSRTFAEGGGISLCPLNPNSRYPKGYLIYGPGFVMDYMPEDEPNIRVRKGILEIIGPPERPKFVIDQSEGWMAYITKDDQLFIKKFPVYPNRLYGDMAGNTTSVWYNGNTMCEIEPMGPLEIIEPGKSASFTETWYLTDYQYPEDRKADLDEIRKLVDNIK